jgi:glucose/arabinose dehydrogenase
MSAPKIALLLLFPLLLAGCGKRASLPESATTGPDPTLPAPSSSLFPTMHIATAIGWGKDQKPKAGGGLGVGAFASGLDHPRWLYVLPNGDVLVAETNAPPRPDDEKGIKAFITKLVMRRAGAGTPSANRITLLRDADGDGVAEFRSVLLKNLNSPFGMALVGGQLYVANTDAVLRFPYSEGQTEITAAGEKVADLPGGPRNHHWTKSLVASPFGTHLYVGVGSNSNAAENGLEAEQGRALILDIDTQTGRSRVFASGLRNPVGLAASQSGTLWVVVNERDELGSDLVPDYLTSVRDGGFYGFPFSYWGKHVDERVKPQNPQMVEKAIVPDYALGNHVAPLGLALSEGTTLTAQYAPGAFVAEHGSWNREPFSGYKVVYIPFVNGRPSGKPVDVLTGFLNDKEEAQGRPVGLALDKSGALLVADDVGNTIWRVK